MCVTQIFDGRIAKIWIFKKIKHMWAPKKFKSFSKFSNWLDPYIIKTYSLRDFQRFSDFENPIVISRIVTFFPELIIPGSLKKIKTSFRFSNGRNFYTMIVYSSKDYWWTMIYRFWGFNSQISSCILSRLVHMALKREENCSS